MVTALRIDGKRIDTDPKTAVAVSIDAEKLLTIAKHTEGIIWSRITIPATPHNKAVLGFTDQILSAGFFNNDLHTFEIDCGGTTLFNGYVRFVDYRMDQGEERFTLQPDSSGRDCIDAIAGKTVATLFDSWEQTLTGDMISSSWWGTPLVRYLPVLRHGDDRQSLTAATAVLSVADYHPFVHLQSTVNEIFADAGYRVDSSMFGDTLFESLYFSGSYKKRNVGSLKQRMDFLAGRFNAVSAAADRFGRVYCDPFNTLNTIGNIVDSANPDDVLNGEKIKGVFDNGGCFATKNNAVCFTPKEKVTAGFEYYLHYTTGYRILNRNELTGFDTVYFGYGDTRKFTLKNEFSDCRSSFLPNTSYRCVIFGHKPGREYMLMGTYEDGNGTNTVLIAEITSRAPLVQTSQTGKYSKVTLYMKDEQGVFYEYMNDWALYYGSVNETGTKNVAVKLVSAPEDISPSSPKRFDSIYFGGAEEDMTFTLYSDTTLRPVFMPAPVQNSQINFGDITAQDIKRTDLLQAVEHMFCLRFYPDEESKTVIIEPETGFHDSPHTDWTNRIDAGKPITIEESDFDADSLTLRYRPATGTVGQSDASEGRTLGTWKFETGKPYYASRSETLMNPLFAPSLNVKGIHPSAPSAQVISTGDGSDSDTRIVSFAGLQPLPSGETWDWPTYGSVYPLAAFILTENTADMSVVSPKYKRSLAFEDRDGCKGLNAYWEKRAARYRESRRLTLYIRLEPSDIENLLRHGDEKRDLRSTYLFTVNGETTLWILERIENYSPDENSAKCVFRRKD